ncbi:hypothetical protein ACPV55_27300 [Vibrio mediterranei]
MNNMNAAVQESSNGMPSNKTESDHFVSYQRLLRVARFAYFDRLCGPSDKALDNALALSDSEMTARNQRVIKLFIARLRREVEHQRAPVSLNKGLRSIVNELSKKLGLFAYGRPYIANRWATLLRDDVLNVYEEATRQFRTRHGIDDARRPYTTYTFPIEWLLRDELFNSPLQEADLSAAAITELYHNMYYRKWEGKAGELREEVLTLFIQLLHRHFNLAQ